MKSGLMLLVFFVASRVLAGGFMLKEENDAFGFPHSDRFYTQGLEIQYIEDPVITNGVETRHLYGLRNVFYTPRDISIAAPQPDDRPWAGMTAASYTTWKFDKQEFVSSEWLFGVVGPWSCSDDIQTWFHGIIHNRLPQGWTNQIPNEPILNYTEDHHLEAYMVGSHGGWGFDVVEDYGVSLGNAYVYGDGGLSARAGWGIPEDCKIGIIEPTLMKQNRYSLYIFGGVNGKLMLQNIMLGGSLFQNGPYQDLKPFVLDVDVGVSMAARRIFGSQTDFVLSYIQIQRSKEFDEQVDPQRFGSITLAFMRGF